MPEGSDQLRELRRQLRVCRKALKDARDEITALCSVLDMGFMSKDWEPDARIERQYGPAFTWSYPLRSYLSSLDYDNMPLTRDVCGRVVAIFESVLLRMLAKQRYGLDLPHEERPSVMTEERMMRSLTLEYPPCVVCGEKRITHDCHILPRIEGGAYAPRQRAGTVPSSSPLVRPPPFAAGRMGRHRPCPGRQDGDGTHLRTHGQTHPPASILGEPRAVASTASDTFELLSTTGQILCTGCRSSPFPLLVFSWVLVQNHRLRRPGHLSKNAPRQKRAIASPPCRGYPKARGSIAFVITSLDISHRSERVASETGPLGSLPIFPQRPQNAASTPAAHRVTRRQADTSAKVTVSA